MKPSSAMFCVVVLFAGGIATQPATAAFGSNAVLPPDTVPAVSGGSEMVHYRGCCGGYGYYRPYYPYQRHYRGYYGHRYYRPYRRYHHYQHYY